MGTSDHSPLPGFGFSDVFRSCRTTTVFCEIPDSPRADNARRSIIANHAPNQNFPFFGFKLRTGGLTADAFPSVEQLADAVIACRDHRCRWKATAGLHHPLRHYDSKIGVKMHGFLNVLFAAVFAETRQLSEKEVQEILADADPADFRIDDDGIRWRGFSASVAEIESARRCGFHSFGSCSFDEPRDDLRSLGLLPA